MKLYTLYEFTKSFHRKLEQQVVEPILFWFNAKDTYKLLMPNIAVCF